MDGIRRSAVFVAVACCTVMPHSLSGQEMGDRLRVTLGFNWVEGEVIRMSPGQLELAVAGGGSRVFGRDAITQVERIVRRSQGRRGFVIGGATGWLLGGAFLSMFAEALEPNLTTFSDKVGYFAVAAVAFGIPCGLIGAFIGSRIKSDRWEIVPGWGGRGGAPGLLLDLQPGPSGGASLLVGARIR